MSGSYPDYPDNRMALDVDGSALLKIGTANSITDITGASAATLNNESSDSATLFTIGAIGTSRFVWLFPELRDLTGYFIAEDAGTIALHWSADTTNGVDGTWTSITAGATTVAGSGTNPGYRNSVASISVSGAKAIRASVTTSGPTFNGTVSAFHVFGRVHTGETPDRLELWHPTLAQRVGGAHFDWGNTPRSSAGDVTFRVKNLSASLTATAVTVSVETLTDTTPSVAGQHTVSDDGASFFASVNLGSLAPGAISSVVTLRRATPSNATLGLWTFRAKAVAGSWV